MRMLMKKLGIKIFWCLRTLDGWAIQRIDEGDVEEIGCVGPSVEHSGKQVLD